MVQDLGIDGFEVDTVKHSDETSMEVETIHFKLRSPFMLEKKKQPNIDVLDAQDIYMMGGSITIYEFLEVIGI